MKQISRKPGRRIPEKGVLFWMVFYSAQLDGRRYHIIVARPWQACMGVDMSVVNTAGPAGRVRFCSTWACSTFINRSARAIGLDISIVTLALFLNQ